MGNDSRVLFRQQKVKESMKRFLQAAWIIFTTMIVMLVLFKVGTSVAKTKVSTVEHNVIQASNFYILDGSKASEKVVKRTFADNTGYYIVKYSYNPDGTFYVPATSPYGKPHWPCIIDVYRSDNALDPICVRVCDTFKGQFTEDGCFEDNPENVVKQALKNAKEKKQETCGWMTNRAVYLEECPRCDIKGEKCIPIYYVYGDDKENQPSCEKGHTYKDRWEACKEYGEMVDRRSNQKIVKFINNLIPQRQAQNFYTFSDSDTQTKVLFPETTVFFEDFIKDRTVVLINNTLRCYKCPVCAAETLTVGHTACPECSTPVKWQWRDKTGVRYLESIKNSSNSCICIKADNEYRYCPWCGKNLKGE